MVDPIFQSTNYQLAQKLLDASVLRLEGIASNIANAETPGYRRIEVSSDFAAQLKACLNNEGKKDFSQLRPTLVEDQHARAIRPDGNTVEIEHELIDLNRNAVEHEYLIVVVGGSLKKLRLAITGHE